MKKLIYILLFFAAGLLPLSAQEAGQKSLDKRNLVTREWNTDVSTNLKYLDHETVYNAEGRKIQETEYTKTGKLWTKKFEYGPDGKVVRELTYNAKGKLDNIQKFEYNEYGKKQAVYTYDAKGKAVKIKIFEYQVRESE